MNAIDVLAAGKDLMTPGTSACQGCISELSMRNVVKVLGKKTVIGIPPGCMAGAGGGGFNAKSGFRIPSTMSLLGNSAALMAGIKAAYDMDDPDVNVLAFSGDGATADAGIGCLSAAAERRDNIIYICYDNEGYMNTGFQKSGTTPFGASTSTTPAGSIGRGKINFKKDMPMIMAAHDAAYVATMTAAYPADFVAKLEKAKTIKDGLVYLHIFSPCTSGWGFNPESGIEVCRKAVQTRYFPLFEYRNYEYAISAPTKNIKEPLDIAEFTRMQKRFRHLNEYELDTLRTHCSNRFNMLEKLSR